MKISHLSAVDNGNTVEESQHLMLQQLDMLRLCLRLHRCCCPCHTRTHNAAICSKPFNKCCSITFGAHPHTLLQPPTVLLSGLLPHGMTVVQQRQRQLPTGKLANWQHFPTNNISNCQQLLAHLQFELRLLNDLLQLTICVHFRQL